MNIAVFAGFDAHVLGLKNSLGRLPRVQVLPANLGAIDPSSELATNIANARG
jgi:hypothetical protein